jgi:hypothetical protein
MTTNEFKNYLRQYSPFKVKGNENDMLTFKDESLFINDKFFENIVIEKTDWGFSISYTGGAIPFYANLKITIPENVNFPVIVNYDEQKLKNDRYRHKEAEDGFFIMTTTL